MNEEYTTVKLDVPRLSDFQIKEGINNGLNLIEELNKLAIEDTSERYIRELLNRINKALEILHNINEDLPLDLILTEIEHTEYVLKGDKE